VLNPSKKTFLKINGNHDKDYPGSNTSRWFLDALLAGLRDLGFADLTVIEGAGYLFSATNMIRNTRLDEICRKHGVPFVDYESLPRNRLALPAMIEGAQLINVPVMHMHGFAVVSCAVKNYFGLIPNDRWKYHERLEEKLMEIRRDVNLTTTTLTIVDGTVGQKGDSTRTGDPVKMDLFVVGKDEVAVDVVVSHMMGFTTDEIPQLKYAKAHGQLDFAVDVRGDYRSFDQLPNYHFRFTPTGAKRLSKWIHRNPVTKAVVTRDPFRTMFHATRGFYQDYIFWKKQKHLFTGPWMAYEAEMQKGGAAAPLKEVVCVV
jgi:uncharacterized protein (DUF362 family)